ncbi:MAG TPA: glutathione S-transferase family protein [Kiloniellales bacterium]|nr:glutathione S-transferase family protein [Kiloniellales bacterium]
MLLVGRDLSPFVRRCAITLRLYGLPFERAEYSTATQLEEIRRYNKLARVPALVLDSGETLIDSTAILDYLDETVGERRLTPASGKERRQALRVIFQALGVAEKTILHAYERNPAMRDPAHRSESWLERISLQAAGGLAALETELGEQEWFVGHRMTQADITAAVVYDFVAFMLPDLLQRQPCPQLGALCDRLSQQEAFRKTSLEQYR